MNTEEKICMLNGRFSTGGTDNIGGYYLMESYCYWRKLTATTQMEETAKKKKKYKMKIEFFSILSNYWRRLSCPNEVHRVERLNNKISSTKQMLPF